MHAGFTFADAEAVVPYLGELGVTHLYLSPVLQAVPGSAHGYDVLDHTQVNAELGGRAGLLSLADAARGKGLGIVVDVVPNHMAMVAPEDANAPLWDVLMHGRGAEHAHWFDIDWDALDQRIGLPVLGEPLHAVVAKGDLRLCAEDRGPVVRYYDHVFPVAEGTWDGDPGADLGAVLSRQHYRLAGWRERDELLNYRRFFDVDSLIAVRVEEPDVFKATHRVLLDLNHDGIIEGFRIDHPDGLADPAGYLEQLRAATRPGTAIWVEKILEGDELLPTWPCDGTTGYDAALAVSRALVDRTTAPALSHSWEATGGDPSLEHVVAESKRLVVEEVLVPERRRLLRRAHEALPDTEAQTLGAALTELLVACEVYRAYVRPGRPVDGVAARRLADAFEAAGAVRPDLKSELQQLVRLAKEPDGDPALDFALRLQQTWGPVMAKGIEDTAFYRWHRLVALNEVGGDPGLLDDAAPEQMHAWAIHQQQDWPLGMTTLSTHDTKRSEDVRARLIAVADDAESWLRCGEAFADEAHGLGIDAPTAHLVWQTLVGVGEIDDERLQGYLTKAVRAIVLGQKLLQLTLPGVPDTYQGCEVVNLSLVDPDNRRAVDYEALRRRLARVRVRPRRTLDDEKLLVTHMALTLRKELSDCFGDRGDYQPLAGSSRHLVGFLRGGEVATLVTRAPKRLEVSGGWRGATFLLPEGLWRDELTGALFGGAENLCIDVFSEHPVALLRRVHRS